MRARLERWLLARWYGAPGLLLLLLPLEGLFRLVAAWRRFRRQRRPPPVPLVVVGNIGVGGAGKTPLVLWLAAQLAARGLRVGIISRGHGGQGPFPLAVTAATPVAACGDEPLLLARRSGVPVVVDPQRCRALAALPPVDVVLSDDGLQHYALPRSVEIAVVDARRGLGNGHCLPVGPLREPASRLRRVDFVVRNGGAAGDGVAMQLRPGLLRRVGDPAQALDAAAFRAAFGGRVTAVAGIGDPSRFFATLADLGFAVDGHGFPDHHPFTAAELASLARPLVMTEKDAVKCAGIADAWYLEVTAELSPDFLPALLRRAGLEERT